MLKAGRPEDEEVGDLAHHVWAFHLRRLEDGATEVTESFDCSRSPEWLRKAVRDGDRWREAMTATLAHLEELALGA